MQNLLNRFLGYVRFDTSPDETNSTSPSSIRQILFAERLRDELEKAGLADVTLDGNGYVMATLPANTGSNRPVVGFIAHMDTSPESPSENVNPMVHRDYDGGDIILNPDAGTILSPNDFPELARYRGQTIITSDGSTLL